MDKGRHVYHHGWANTQTYQRVDSFLQNRLGRPSREERYENREKALREGLSAAIYGSSFLIGSGRVRAGKAGIRLGTKTVNQVGRRLYGGSLWARERGKMALESVPKLIGAAQAINTGLRTKRQGRILQAAGLFGYLRSR